MNNPSQQTAEQHCRLAMEHHRAGRMAQAAQEWARAAQLDPNHPETRNNLGVALQSLGQWQAARAALLEATRLRPTYADAWENLAGVLLAMERNDEAVAAAREMVRHVPTVPSHVILATALARSG